MWLRFEEDRFEEIADVRRIVSERSPGARERRLILFVGEDEVAQTFLWLVNRRWRDARG